MSITVGGNTWAEDNPAIEHGVLIALRALHGALDQMMSMNAEGQSILEALVEANAAIEGAIHLYVDEDSRED